LNLNMLGAFHLSFPWSHLYSQILVTLCQEIQRTHNSLWTSWHKTFLT
jgi:hypothetical protein